MSTKGIKILLEEIEVNKENFRHSPLNNELEAIHYLITEDYESYLNLARTMAKDCRTFTVLILERNNDKILMDANRRVSVLKIFNNPKLIPSDKEYDDLRHLCIARGSLGIKELNADIYYDSIDEDKENLMDALDELHINDNKTRKDWNALSQYRASQFIGSEIKHPWIKTLEYYGFSDDQIIQMTNKRTDIFNRIMRKSQLNILENGKINLNNDNAIINELCKIVKDRAYFLEDKPIKVNTRTQANVYKDILDDLIKKYSNGQLDFTFNIDNLKNQTEADSGVIPPEQTAFNFNKDVDSIDSNEDENEDLDKKTDNRSPLKRDVEKRNTVISQEQKNELSMTLNRQVNQIAHELSILNLNVYIISVPIILRSFLQYSFEWYASSKNISYNHTNLIATITSVMNKMFENNLISHEEKGALKALLKNAEIINLLNEATHNFQAPVVPKTILIDFYNSIHPVVKHIYKDNSGQ